MVLAACSSSSSSSGSPAGGGNTSYCRADGSNSGTGSQTCTTLGQEGACYQVVYAKAFTPPQGGAVTDGIYVATGGKIIDATKVEGAPFVINPPLTIQFKGGTVERLIDPGTVSVPVEGIKGQVSNQDATTLKIDLSCPATQTQTWPYTATATTLILQDEAGIGETTYEKK